MKKILSIVFCFVALCAQAQTLDSIAQPDSLSIDTMSIDTLAIDSILATDSLEMVEEVIAPVVPFYELWDENNLSDIEMRSLDWSLRWLDTTFCEAVHDTTTLPDSVYKARLQALPCVIELPYNERVRAFIIRYVKRSPKQVARMMRMGEY